MLAEFYKEIHCAVTFIFINLYLYHMKPDQMLILDGFLFNEHDVAVFNKRLLNFKSQIGVPVFAGFYCRQ